MYIKSGAIFLRVCLSPVQVDLSKRSFIENFRIISLDILKALPCVLNIFLFTNVNVNSHIYGFIDSSFIHLGPLAKQAMQTEKKKKYK